MGFPKKPFKTEQVREASAVTKESKQLSPGQPLWSSADPRRSQKDVREPRRLLAKTHMEEKGQSAEQEALTQQDTADSQRVLDAECGRESTGSMRHVVTLSARFQSRRSL